MLSTLQVAVSALVASLSVTLIPSLLILLAGIVAIKLVNKILKTALNKTNLEKAAHSLILSVANVAMYILLGLITATKLGIDVTSIVALASVLTLAVSLALQNMLANVFGGFTLLSTTPFHSGDYVEIAGQGGTVTEINMTYTRLATPDGKLISIPNSSVVAAQIVNYSAEPVRRVDVNVSVNPTVPVQKVLDALVLAGTVDKALTTPAPFAAVTGYVDGRVNYVLRVWVNNPDFWDVTFEVNQKVKKVFDEQEIPMAFPHMNVHIDK